MENLDSGNTFLAGNKIRLTIPAESIDLTLFNGTPKYCCSLTYRPLNIDKTVTNTNLGTIWLIDKDKDANDGINIILPNNPQNLDAKVTVALYAYDPTMDVDITTNEPKEKTRASSEKTIYVFANQAPTLSIKSINWVNDDNYPATIVYDITPGLVNPSGWANASNSWQSYWNDFQSYFATNSNYIEATMSLVYSSVPDLATESSKSTIATTSISNFQVNFAIPSSIVSDDNKAWYFTTTIQYNNLSEYYNVYSSEIESDLKILPPNTPQLQIQKNGIKINAVKTDNDNSAAIQVRKIENNTAAGYNLALYDDTRTDGSLNNQPNIAFCSNNVLAADMRLSDSALMLKHRGRNYYDTIVTASDLNETRQESLIHLGIARVMCGKRSDESKIIQNKEALNYFYNGYTAASQYKGIFNSGVLNFRQITELGNNYFCCELNDNYTITKIHVKLHLSGAFVDPTDETTATDGVIWFSRIAHDTWTGWPTFPPSSNPWIIGGTIHHFPAQTNGWHSATHEYWVYQSFNDITKAVTINGTTTSVIPIPDGYFIHAQSSGNFWFCRDDIGSNLMVEVYGYPNQWIRTS